jgi:hypothetical protein
MSHGPRNLHPQGWLRHPAHRESQALWFAMDRNKLFKRIRCYGAEFEWAQARQRSSGGV